MKNNLLLLILTLLATRCGYAQDYLPRYFDTGTPVVIDLFVNPVSGDDSNSGRTSAQPLRTLTAAWGEIPMNSTLLTGFQINLAPGTYPESSIPNYFESRHGTLAAPVIIRSSGAPGSAILGGDLNVFDCRYLYLIGVTVRPDPAGDAFHCERCDHLLLRGSTFDGGNRAAHETIKINQSQHVYIENSNISGADDNALDFVAVQYGHVVGNRIHNAGDWCAYAKGGSAYLRINDNAFFNCGTGGFTAGQGTGFEFMESPWLHYEAYDIKFFNNIVHDTEGAAIGVNGGFNVVMAFNTFYRVGRRSHGIEVVFGARSCDGDTARCAAYRSLGGWGSANSEEPIPNRNIFIVNNVLFNPPGFRSEDQHLAIYPPRTPSAGSNVPTPARTDTNLVIRGNIFRNATAELPLGIEDSGACEDTNPTCSEAQLRDENSFNTLEPLLSDPENEDLRPRAGGALLQRASVPLTDFTDTGRPTVPAVPSGELSNRFPEDRGGSSRSADSPPGAYARYDSPLLRSIADDSIPSTPSDPRHNRRPSVTILSTGVTRASAVRRVTVVARCADPDGALSGVTATVSGRGMRAKRAALERRSGSTYRGVLRVSPTARLVSVAVTATDTEGARTTKRRALPR